MKLLLDANLSRRLIRQIRDLFPESVHVASLGLLQGADIWVWEYAKRNGFAIVTTAADFNERATADGHPPKVIWLRGFDCSTTKTEAFIRSQATTITGFEEDSAGALLILHP